MSDTADTTCRRNCWLLSALGALLVAVLLKALAGFSLVAALFFGAMFLVLFGSFVVWAFCTGRGQDAAPRLAPMPEVNFAPVKISQPAAVTPRPEPVRPAVAAPVAAPAAAEPAPKAKAPRAKAAKAAAAAAPVAAAPAKAKAEKAAAKPATPRMAPKAAGLDAAMDKTKSDVAEPAATTLLAAPRGGKGDDLKQIKGVGPKLEKLLNSIGVWHFDQIASWKAKDIALVDARMEGFKGRISRDGWVKQAKVLAKGGTTEFSKRVAKGEVY